MQDTGMNHYLCSQALEIYENLVEGEDWDHELDVVKDVQDALGGEDGESASQLRIMRLVHL